MLVPSRYTALHTVIVQWSNDTLYRRYTSSTRRHSTTVELGTAGKSGSTTLLSRGLYSSVTSSLFTLFDGDVPLWSRYARCAHYARYARYAHSLRSITRYARSLAALDRCGR